MCSDDLMDEMTALCPQLNRNPLALELATRGIVLVCIHVMYNHLGYLLSLKDHVLHWGIKKHRELLLTSLVNQAHTNLISRDDMNLMYHDVPVSDDPNDPRRSHILAVRQFMSVFMEIVLDLHVYYPRVRLGWDSFPLTLDRQCLTPLQGPVRFSQLDLSDLKFYSRVNMVEGALDASARDSWRALIPALLQIPVRDHVHVNNNEADDNRGEHGAHSLMQEVLVKGLIICSSGEYMDTATQRSHP